jgi:hypothetical protein
LEDVGILWGLMDTIRKGVQKDEKNSGILSIEEALEEILY